MSSSKSPLRGPTSRRKQTRFLLTLELSALGVSAEEIDLNLREVHADLCDPQKHGKLHRKAAPQNGMKRQASQVDKCTSKERRFHGYLVRSTANEEAHRRVDISSAHEVPPMRIATSIAREVHANLRDHLKYGELHRKVLIEQLEAHESQVKKLNLNKRYVHGLALQSHACEEANRSRVIRVGISHVHEAGDLDFALAIISSARHSTLGTQRRRPLLRGRCRVWRVRRTYQGWQLLGATCSPCPSAWRLYLTL